mgnify:CR=1 FL=1
MKRPHVICEPCWREAQRHWLGDLLAFCPHFRVLVRRHWIDQPWTIESDTSELAAIAIRAAAVSAICARLAKRGITGDDADRIMNELTGRKEDTAAQP